nr:hypothetical protein [uncultured Capnocytophaga sp.]
MSKRFIWSLFAFFVLQSCAVTNTFTFHDDATISTETVVDMSKMEELTQSEKGSSIKNLNMASFPKEWQTLYAFKNDTLSVETEDLLKRSAIKGLFKEEKEVGFQLRLDHFTPEECEKMSKTLSKSAQGISVFNFSAFQWDGETLHLDMKMLEKGKGEEAEERVAQMKRMFNIEVSNTLVFENRIKKIKGKHPNLQKIDAHTLRIVTTETADSKKKYPEQIEIVTRK